MTVAGTRSWSCAENSLQRFDGGDSGTDNGQQRTARPAEGGRRRHCTMPAAYRCWRRSRRRSASAVANRRRDGDNGVAARIEDDAVPPSRRHGARLLDARRAWARSPRALMFHVANHGPSDRGDRTRCGRARSAMQACGQINKKLRMGDNSQTRLRQSGLRLRGVGIDALTGPEQPLLSRLTGSY